MNEAPYPAARIVWRSLVPLAVMATIFLGSSRTMPIEIPSGPDKLLHAGAYAVLAGAWGWALAPRLSAGRCAVAAAVLASLYGASDEWHQSFVSGRDSSVIDWLADLAGAFLAGVLIWRCNVCVPAS